MNQKRDTRMGLLFAAPWIIGFAVFMAYPLIASVLFSFTDYSILRSPHWIGVSNYKELFHDEVFFIVLKNTILYSLGAIPLCTVVAIGLAMLINQPVKGLSVYRTMFFLPSLVPMVALGTLFLWVFNGDYGVLNPVFRSVGLTPPNWLGDPAWSKWTLVLISMWGCGQAMIIYLAGLQGVPVSLYEAAEIDGAKAWAKTLNVTLPMLSPVILFNVVMGIIGSLQIFAVPYVMFPGGAPARSTYFYASYIYDMAMQYQRMGYASAMGWILFLIILGLTYLAIRLSERHVHYEGG